MICVLIFYRYLIALCCPCRTAQLFREKIQINPFLLMSCALTRKNSTNTHPNWSSIASHPSPCYSCWVHNNNRTSIKMSSYNIKELMQFTHDFANIIKTICWNIEIFFIVAWTITLFILCPKIVFFSVYSTIFSGHEN